MLYPRRGFKLKLDRFMGAVECTRAILFWKRPFANVHWSILIIFIGLWELWLWKAWWGRFLSYGPVLVTITVCSALWASYQRVSPVKTFRSIAVLGQAMYDVVSLALWLAILAIPIPFVSALYGDVSPRAAVGDLIWSDELVPVREAIAKRIIQRHSVSGTGAERISATGRIEDGLVSNDGTIVVMTIEPRAVVILQPMLGDGKVEWKCFVSPAILVPKGCQPIDGQNFRSP